MRHATVFGLFAVSLLVQAQDFSNSSNISVSGDAEIQVTPDRVRLSFSVETRDKVLTSARARNDATVKAVLAAARSIEVDASDIQTDFIKVDLRYQNGDSTVVD